VKIVVHESPDRLDDSFADLPHEVYADDPLWIPEEEDTLRRAFSSSNAWFAHGQAATFSIKGRARLAVFRTQTCIIDEYPAAFFGFFESDGDATCAGALLDAGAEWARGAGANVLYGPVNFNTHGSYRLRLSAEPGGIPFPGEPYNRPEYSAILAENGFSEAMRYVTQVSDFGVYASESQRNAAEKLKAAGYMFEPLDGSRWMGLLPQLHRMADEIFGEAFAYSRVSYDEFAAAHGEQTARRLCPHTSVLAIGPSGDIAGFLISFPNYGPLLVQGSRIGRVRLSELTYGLHQPMLAAAGHSTAVAKTIGVHPEHRRYGLMSAIGAIAMERGRGRYDRWIAALVRENNVSRRFAGPHSHRLREYALYRRFLTDMAPTCRLDAEN
jgi:ribosomal protein S18 acetylase RimI-like enzyme